MWYHYYCNFRQNTDLFNFIVYELKRMLPNIHISEQQQNLSYLNSTTKHLAYLVTQPSPFAMHILYLCRCLVWWEKHTHIITSKWFRFIIAKIYNILRYVIPHIYVMCNLRIKEKTNLILGFSSPLKTSKSNNIDYLLKILHVYYE